MQNATLRGRYKIVKNLGRGGFGETYLAEDLDRPSYPKCVVKKLHATFNSVQQLEIAKRFFNNEAQVLYKVGDRHRQIPRLLAHFEENNEFYLVQDFVDGHDLSTEILSETKWNEAQVIYFLKDILRVLEFVHQQNVIHRDIKPANVIRRKQDGKMVLIDFGAVKEIQKLTFGVSNTNRYKGNINNSAVVQLTVYRDHQKVGSKEVKRGEKQFWQVDVSNVQNIALEAEFIKTKQYGSYCPSIVFTQADLE